MTLKTFLDSGLRPSGMVERTCVCGWTSWFDPLSEEATAIPFICKGCIENPETGARCSACNHHFRTLFKDLNAMGYHPRCKACKDIPPMQFAKVVHCWCCNCDMPMSSDERPCCGNATQEKHYPKHCDCEACWQTWYHVCDKHAEDWMYDKSDTEQKAIMRRRGARIIELENGWTFEFPKKIAPSTN